MDLQDSNVTSSFFCCSVYRSHVFLQVCFGFERFSTTATVEILTFWFSWLFFIVTRSRNWELEMLETGLCSFPMWSFFSFCLLNFFLQTFHWKLHLWFCQVDYHRWQEFLFLPRGSLFLSVELLILCGLQMLLSLPLKILVSCHLQMLRFLDLCCFGILAHKCYNLKLKLRPELSHSLPMSLFLC